MSGEGLRGELLHHDTSFLGTHTKLLDLAHPTNGPFEKIALGPFVRGARPPTQSPARPNQRLVTKGVSRKAQEMNQGEGRASSIVIRIPSDKIPPEIFLINHVTTDVCCPVRSGPVRRICRVASAAA